MSDDTEELDICPECRDDVENDDGQEHDGDVYHSWCLSVCDECDDVFPESDTVTTTGRWRSTGTYCRDHAFSCDGCGETRPDNEAHAMASGYETGCDDCASYCEGCCEYVWSDDAYYSDRDGCTYCEGCYEDREHGDGIREYGHTDPVMWLGGPLPKNDKGEHVGYYVGFELEISADVSSGAMEVHAWSDRHMTAGALDCKHDSSVAGFEIASQPMTPAYFESRNWESFFRMLENEYPTYDRREPYDHGLHVHIGRVAFRRDDVAIAMFCYLLAQDGQKHLTRIARRDPYHYCKRVDKPVSTAIVRSKPYGRQGRRLSASGVYPGRDAINLENRETIEIRSFRSTRNADELRDAVRVVYLAADYVMSLRASGFVTPRALHWGAFAAWVKINHREAYKSIRGPKATRKRKAA